VVARALPRHAHRGLPLGPEARYDARESIALSFVAGLQHLPAQQRAVLVLRDMPWYSAQDSVATLLSPPRQPGRMHLVCYLRDGDRVFETYWTTLRGVEAMDYSYALMDLTVYGRQESWEDSPPGWPQQCTNTRTDAGPPAWPPVPVWPPDAPSPSGPAWPLDTLTTSPSGPESGTLRPLRARPASDE
jgi:hypothetical protein